MEVHHHSHTARKIWTHYFWEFLMLFLAVFCGFLAEYQLEHIIENKREKQFANSLLNDLRLDTAWLNIVSNSARSRIENIDSALDIVAQSGNSEISLTVYQQLRKSTQQMMFIPHNGTISQLKSSGGMRLIRKRNVVDSIENYDRLIRRLEIRRDITNELIRDFTAILNKTLNGKDLLRGYYDSVVYQKNLVPGMAVKLNDQFLNELINYGITMRLRAVGDINANSLMSRTALTLIELLRKEYHLK